MFVITNDMINKQPEITWTLNNKKDSTQSTVKQEKCLANCILVIKTSFSFGMAKIFFAY